MKLISLEANSILCLAFLGRISLVFGEYGRKVKRIYPIASHKLKSISLVAPSSAVDPVLLKKGEKKILRQGYELHYEKNDILARHRYFAGQAKLRAQALVNSVKDSRTSIVWCARGGYGAAELLPFLDKLRLSFHMRKRRKIFLGYSDVSILHGYFLEKARIACLHAPLLATPHWLLCRGREEKFLFSVLEGKMNLGKNSNSCSWPTRHLLQAREEEGILKGGNLSVLCSLIGTPWQLSFKNSILFLEDCGEAPYRLDRMLLQLFMAGSFQGLRAVVLGDLSYGVKEKNRILSWKEVFRSRFSPMNIPVITGVPVGHTKRNEALPLGVRVRITRQGKLEFLEQLAR